MKVNEKKLIYNSCIQKYLKKGVFNYNDLLISNEKHISCLEYIDPYETNNIVISTYINDINKKINYTHCEIHPSLILGALASCIPFPH